MIFYIAAFIIMIINQNMKLILHAVYLYDITACHYNIMKNLGLDISEINFEDKKIRNIQIGKLMQKNPRLTTTLRTTTKSIIDQYILQNNIQEDEIILRQYDGIIITKVLRETDIHKIKLDLQKQFQIFISSIDRKKYIALDSNLKTTVKGVTSNYPGIEEYYRKLCLINFANKSSIFRNLQRLKDEFLNNKNNKTFAIPTKDEKFIIYLKDYGELVTSGRTLNILDPNSIDKEKYFKFYIEPFTKSITLEFLR